MSYTKGYRYRVVPGSDNKYAVVHKELQSPAYSSAIKITALSPDSEEIIVDFDLLTGALSLTADVVQPYTSDKMRCCFQADGSARTVTLSTGFITNGTIAINANKTANVEFKFQGKAGAWVETSRFIQT